MNVDGFFWKTEPEDMASVAMGNKLSSMEYMMLLGKLHLFLHMHLQPIKTILAEKVHHPRPARLVMVNGSVTGHQAR